MLLNIHHLMYHHAPLEAREAEHFHRNRGDSEKLRGSPEATQ